MYFTDELRFSYKGNMYEVPYLPQEEWTWMTDIDSLCEVPGADHKCATGKCDNCIYANLIRHDMEARKELYNRCFSKKANLDNRCFSKKENSDDKSVYKILKADSTEKLSELVKDYIENGWVPSGGVTFAGEMYMQVMIKQVKVEFTF